MSSNTDVSISLSADGSTATINQADKVKLYKGDSLTVTLDSSFPAGCSVDGVDVYGNTTVNGKDAKDSSNPRGHWTRSEGSSGLNGEFVVQALTTTSVKVTDDEDNVNKDKKYWYALKIDGPGGPWSPDPELVNKKPK